MGQARPPLSLGTPVRAWEYAPVVPLLAPRVLLRLLIGGMMKQTCLMLAAVALLAACVQDNPAAAWPESLRPFGDGFPKAGDQCRRVGETAATIDYLDHTSILVGCPTAAQAEALGGQVVGRVDGFTLVSLPRTE